MAAKEWGLRPSALGLCRADEDLGVMVAYTDARNRMQAWEQLQAEKKRKR